MLRESVPLLLILTLAACSKGPASDAPSAPAEAAATPTAAVEAPDSSAAAPAATAAAGPCGGVTEADVSAAMGHDMKFGTASRPEECSFVSATGDATKAAAFQLMTNSAETVYAQMAAQGAALPGVGDKAVIFTGSHQVVALQGGRLYFGGAYDASDAASMRGKSIELAKRVLARQ